jgi:hypothetical protein
LRQRYLLSFDSIPSEDFATDLRETLLQDSLYDLVDERLLIAEIAARVCVELAYGKPSPWRVYGYGVLCEVYETAHGRQCLQNLGQSGHLIDDLATTVFTKQVA